MLLYFCIFLVVIYYQYLNFQISTITLFYIFGGYYSCTHLPNFNQAHVWYFLLGLHQPQAFFCLLLFWLCFSISLGVCVCECLIIHTQPFLLTGIIYFGSITYYSFVPVLNVTNIVQSFLVLYFWGCESNGGHAWGFIFVQASSIHIYVCGTGR